MKGIFIREDLSPEERLKRRDRNASRTASVVATDSNLRAVSPTTSQVQALSLRTNVRFQLGLLQCERLENWFFISS